MFNFRKILNDDSVIQLRFTAHLMGAHDLGELTALGTEPCPVVWVG